MAEVSNDTLKLLIKLFFNADRVDCHSCMCLNMRAQSSWLHLNPKTDGGVAKMLNVCRLCECNQGAPKKKSLFLLFPEHIYLFLQLNADIHGERFRLTY